jgi:hypothetical protein
MNSNDQYISLIIKHLSGESSASEEQVLSDWLNENDFNKSSLTKPKRPGNLPMKILIRRLLLLILTMSGKEYPQQLILAKKTI